MTKKVTFIMALVCVISSYTHKISAQTKAERFCEISIFHGKPKKLQITIDYGNNEADTLNLSYLKKVESFNSVADVMNYMSKVKWTLVAVNDLPWNTIFYYKRDFEDAENTSK